MIKSWMVPLLLVSVVILAYSNSFSGAFVLDDQGGIVRNAALRQGVRVAASEGLRARGLVDFTFAVNYATGGLNPADYHATNVWIHLLNVWLVYGGMLVLLKRPRAGGLKDPGRQAAAFWTAALWGVHPLTTSAVTYISQRYEILMATFYLATLFCVLRGADSRRAPGWYAGAVLACAAGMTCKEVMLTAPGVVLLMDRLFLSESWREMWARRRFLYAGLAGTWVWLFFLMSAVLPSAPGMAGAYAHAANPWHYALTQAQVIPHYLRLIVWPTGQCLDYGWPWVTSPWGIGGWGGFFLLLLAGLAWMARWNPRVAWPGLWFLLILAPTSSFLPRPDPAFEHRVYLPMVGIVAGLVLGGLAQAERAIRREPVLDRALRMGLHAALAGMLFALGALTYARNQVFASETRVWEDVLTKRATNLRAYVNLANALYAEGRFEEMGKVADQGLALVPEWRNVPAEDLPRLLEEDKTGQVARQVYAYAQLQNAAGMSWFARGNREEAEQRFIESIRLAAGNRRARANLAVAWTAAGRHADARALWADLLATDPGDASAHFGMAETCAAAQDFERAREHYRQCLAILPDHVAARERLARLPNPAE